MTTVEGFIERIVFHNEENGYTVLILVNDNFEYTLVGTFHYINEGEFLRASGNIIEHSVYGEQLAVENYEVSIPSDTIAVERYLGSGAVRGIGEALAARIVKKFKADTFRIIEEEPERLAEVKGISEKKAREIAEVMKEKKDMRQAMMFLQEYGISLNLAIKIYTEYGPRLYNVIKQNPYKIADDISGIGFKIADEIASKAGIVPDSDFRIKSGLLYTLLQAVGQGHIYLPKEVLLSSASELLGVEISEIEKHIMDMVMDKRLIVKEAEEITMIYASSYYYLELNCAKMLHDLNVEASISREKVSQKLDKIEDKTGIVLDELQREAVMEAVNHGLLIITGGPGTGKTTTINAIIKYFEEENLQILMAAPTGRAAKRMTEATGYEAKTIHRLLELSGGSDDQSISPHRFEHNEENPLDTDIIIIDETSMVDINLMSSLLRAVAVGTRLILVGDINQLPSVGAGNVLSDIIKSKVFKVVMLTKIFRQASQSDIIVNAHKINNGELVDLQKKSEDFLFIKRSGADAVVAAAITLIKSKLPQYVKAKPYEIQVITPMRKGAVGVERLNVILQEHLNPSGKDKLQVEQFGRIYREGDKVMQIKNNYQMEWEIVSRYGIPTDRGLGVFNGDMGIIKTINVFAELLKVEFDEEKIVEYTFKQLEELEHAYAITVHKSQGSEYPAIIIPMLQGPKMLMNRNLIYTAVTRAKTCVCLLGEPTVFFDMVNNKTQQQRYSSLNKRIEELLLNWE
jgi:helicase, putative, RecD/TraA family